MRGSTTACLLALLAAGRIGWAQTGGLEAGASAPGNRLYVAHLANAQEVRKRLGLVPEYEGSAGIESVKVAVLDYGFDGAGNGRPYLPETAEVVEDYDPAFVRRFGLGDPDFLKGFEPLNRHGRVMAQIVWAVTGSHPDGPKFYLLNANGPTMLRRAVRFAIEQKVDVILFSGSFEGGGNGDGRGPIDRTVSSALAAGILWVNAAGNYGHRVYSGPVRVGPDGYLRFRDGTDGTALRFRNRLDENSVTVTLTWNDYQREEDAGTDKDLDLSIEDWAGRRIGAGEKNQVAGDREPGPGESRNPRERVVLNDLRADPDLPGNREYTYRIRVRTKRGKFTAADRIRVLVTAAREVYVPPGEDAPREAVEFLDATGAEELFPPADHPLVLTVGDPSPASSVGPTIDHRIKPDVLLDDSRAFFTDGSVSAGSSNAAAYMAGVVAVLRAAEPRLRPRHLLPIAWKGPTVSALQNPSARASGPRGGTPGSPAPVTRGPAGGTPPGTVRAPAARPAVPPPPPPAPSESQPARSFAATLPVWRTPSRAKLAEAVRADP